MKRQHFLEHVAWTGAAGIAYAVGASGLATAPAGAQTTAATFVQISDSHIGFHQAANPDVAATLQETVAAINAMPVQPAFVMHTGDVTHLSKPDEFDTARQLLATLKAPLIVIPGEHDGLGGFGNFSAAFGRKDAKDGWFSWDQSGVHYIALVNVFNFEKMGLLTQPQLDWLASDLRGRAKDTPLVVFAHVPLYALFPEWGWTTEDGAKALALLAPFSRVTILNGHIHQIVTHSDGHLRFATAAATAYPQPAPGTASGPGPLKVPDDQLLSVLGYRTVELTPGRDAAVADHSLATPG